MIKAAHQTLWGALMEINLAGIGASILVKKLVDRLEKKLGARSYAKKVSKAFHRTFDETPNRILVLAYYCDRFGEPLFSLADGNTLVVDPLLDACDDYAKENGPEFSREKVIPELKLFSKKLINNFQGKWAMKAGDLSVAANIFDRDVCRLSDPSAVNTVQQPQSTPVKPPLPFFENTYLRGHEKWIDLIHKTMTSNGQAAVHQNLALAGEGGIGKTAMASQYAHQYQDQYPGGVFWFKMDSGPASAFTSIGGEMGLPMEPGISDAQVKQMVGAASTAFPGSSW
jgi:hypothetical protein